MDQVILELVPMDIFCKTKKIHLNNKQLLDEAFENNQGRGRGYQPKPKVEADNPYRDLDYSGYHKNRI